MKTSQITIDTRAKQDIKNLRQKIDDFNDGKIPEERFKAYRLTRGVYGQRQPGVQMFRIKIPAGRITSTQLIRIADLSDRYSNGNLHITTRQDIQLHYIHLEDSPEIWELLEETGITTKEACGNTVRNITASPQAGVDPDEPFDVSPYALAAFRYFLRNPVCQEMGRKIKIAFSSGKKDTALTFLHDFGFLPKLNDKSQRGFEVWVGGGLGAQAMPARIVKDFLPVDELLPFLEAGLRVFDRYGEREKRYKARLKFLVDEKRGIGLEKYLELLESERQLLQYQTIEIDATEEPVRYPEPVDATIKFDQQDYHKWLLTNVRPQKQEGLFTIKIQVPLGDLSSENARSLAKLIQKYGTGDLRLTIAQGIYLIHIPEGSLPFFYTKLKELDLGQYGAESIADITACPGTDTCNLGVTNSTAISKVLEELIRTEFNHFITERDIHIKISGCMNSCGQHMIANIGFHGSSIKNGNKVIPALQVVIGGGFAENGEGLIAEKVIKLPTKRIPDALRLILNDYEDTADEEQYFNRYYLEKGKKYFYNLLKPLANLDSLTTEDYIDWGEELTFTPEIGIGECAGVMYDVIGTIIQDAIEKLEAAHASFEASRVADATYNAYGAFVIAAKAILLSDDIHCNTHIGIIRDFEKHFVQTGKFKFPTSFERIVLRKEAFNDDKARSYFLEAEAFVLAVIAYRRKQTGDEEKKVVLNYYKA